VWHLLNIKSTENKENKGRFEGGWFSTKGKETKIRVLKTDHRWKRKERSIERKKGMNKINND